MVLALPGNALAQRRLTGWELGVGGLAAIADADFYGGAAGVARRPGGHTRLAGQVALGAVDGRAAVRVEATAQFVVAPAARAGVGLYLGAGITWQGTERTAGATYLAAVVGLEGAPGRRLGWYLESGVGGGIRVAAGVRWRHFPDWW